MKFTLINGQGRIRLFYVQSVAEMYRNLEGGVVITAEVLDKLVEGATIEV